METGDLSAVRLPMDDAVAWELAQALKLEGFFPEFRAEHAAKLFPRSGLYEYPPEAAIVTQGEPAFDIFIVYTGKVRILKEFGGAIAEMAVMGPGDLLGEIALLRDGVRTATALAGEACQIYRITYQDLQYVLANNIELAAHLKRLVSERLGR